ncbi:UDP-glycosyltransferase 76B1-like [Punica granatum]|uniref:Uncharacterized protein n=2 Tax=Punica granatum TaxID=22663 RepID=A0A218XLD8_PUNGR|nr:UDP-glycosyltransferase 76B1-like [Punica granatum]OWM85479.1 hypothetical protein CDL15_Pgr019103 [Punica granatum]PKI50842.1 hypothetical protein CRG98_028749 [Punica granatum]
MDLKGARSRKNHVHHLVLVPCPLQGHLTPMFHLANLLLSRGFAVTVIQIPSPSWRSLDCTHPNPSFPSLFFEPIADGVACDDDASNAGEDVMSFLLELNSKCREPFRDCLDRVASSAPRGCISCLIHDAVMYFPVDVVEDLSIPRLVLRTSTAANFLGLSLLDQKGFLPPQGTRLVEMLQELPSMRVKDLPLFDKCKQASTEEVLIKIHKGTTTASAIIWNTLTCLEQPSLDKISATLSVPIFPIGPLHRLSAEIMVTWAPENQKIEEGRTGYSAATDEVPRRWAEDRSCIEWLDLHPPGSVVYVSFGSLVTLSESELTEISEGLAESGRPFLWVIRARPVNSASLEAIRELTNTSKRGKITSWAPQREVLAHRSVGCFWTHSGWNSTLESMSEGVPMLCWSYVGDQRIISRLVSGVWKVGLELEVDDGIDSGPLNGSKVASAIKRIMSDEEGREMKRKAMALKEQIDVSLRQSGSSRQFLDKLVAFIHQLA